jgi:hypothetical protein
LTECVRCPQMTKCLWTRPGSLDIIGVCCGNIYIFLELTDCFLGAFAKLRKATINSVMSVCPHGTAQSPTGRIFMKFGIYGFFESLSGKIQVWLKLTLYEHLFPFMICRGIFFRVRNVSDKNCRENQKAYFMFNNSFYRKSCRLCGNVEKCYRDRPQRAVEYDAENMRSSRQITKARMQTQT